MPPSDRKISKRLRIHRAQFYFRESTYWREIFKMGLTWDEFLKLATIIRNLDDSIYYFDSKEIGINEKNQRVAAAAIDYLEFFKDVKYIQFMNEVRISFTNLMNYNLSSNR